MQGGAGKRVAGEAGGDPPYEFSAGKGVFVGGASGRYRRAADGQGNKETREDGGCAS